MKSVISLAVAASILAGCTTAAPPMSREQVWAFADKQCGHLQNDAEKSQCRGTVFASHKKNMFAHYNPDLAAQRAQADRQVAGALLLGAAVVGTIAYCRNHNCGGSSAPVYRGNCKYDWQYDAAGNNCGQRSAMSRPGGR